MYYPFRFFRKDDSSAGLSALGGLGVRYPGLLATLVAAGGDGLECGVAIEVGEGRVIVHRLG
jgi:hypothetical protein